jgi:predicted amidophosphoribosyltransferase
MLKRPSLLPALKWLMADSSQELMPALSPAFSWRAARTQARLDLPVLAAQSYTEEIASLLRRAKYGPQWSSAQKLVRLANKLQAPAWLETPCCLVPVPADPSRLSQRGFHLPNLLCQALGRQWGVAYDLSRLVKGKTSASLASLKREQRLLQLRGLIWCGAQPHPARANALPYPPVVLIDDVVTTGATASACIEALQRAGDRVLGLVVLARSH